MPNSGGSLMHRSGRSSGLTAVMKQTELRFGQEASHKRAKEHLQLATTPTACPPVSELTKQLRAAAASSPSSTKTTPEIHCSCCYRPDFFSRGANFHPSSNSRALRQPYRHIHHFPRRPHRDLLQFLLSGVISRSLLVELAIVTRLTGPIHTRTFTGELNPLKAKGLLRWLCDNCGSDSHHWRH